MNWIKRMFLTKKQKKEVKEYWQTELVKLSLQVEELKKLQDELQTYLRAKERSLSSRQHGDDGENAG